MYRSTVYSWLTKGENTIVVKHRIKIIFCINSIYIWNHYTPSVKPWYGENTTSFPAHHKRWLNHILPIIRYRQHGTDDRNSIWLHTKQYHQVISDSTKLKNYYQRRTQNDVVKIPCLQWVLSTKSKRLTRMTTWMTIFAQIRKVLRVKHTPPGTVSSY